MRVEKIAEIRNGIIRLNERIRIKSGELAAVLTNLELADNPRLDSGWSIDIVIGTGSSKRPITLELPPVISEDDPTHHPIFLQNSELVYFMDSLFMPEFPPCTEAEREEILLRVKLMIFEKEKELATLKSRVSNYEAAFAHSQTGSNRNQIRDDVKLLVWTRDGGACVRCGLKEELHFDHIIPVAKGGGNDSANIQILCAPCNLRKSDKIAFY